MSATMFFRKKKGLMAPNDRGMKNGEGESRKALKKGPWTGAEDAILMEYVNKYGEGNWNAVQRNSGLKRCGKSCRLRWANHLRPNLKKGVFSPEEERIIIDLHAKLGNKWARMAAQLPGRTDNEIKNYWNTRLKRRQRAGLPIYPQELQSQNQQETNEVQSLISSSAFDSQRATYNNSPSLSHLDIFNPSTITHQFPFNSNNTFRDPSLSSIKNSQFSSLSASVGWSNSMLLPSFQQKYPNFKLRTMGIPSNQNELISVIGINYPSGQSSMRVMTASSSENTCSDFGSSDANNYAKVSQGNSGLLEDLLEESQTLTRAVKIEENNYLNLKEEEAKNYKGKSLWEEYGIVEQESGDEEAILTEESVYSFAHAGDVTLNNNSQSSSPDPNSSSGMFMTKQVDEDIMCLLDNFPLGVSVPDLYDVRDDKNKSNGQSSNIDKAAEESKSQVVITTSVLKNHNWELGGYCWNNMPSFC